MLTAMLRKAVEADPERAAIVQGDRRMSYGELYRASREMSAELRAGDIVPVTLPNSPEFAISLFACAQAGAIMLPLDPRYTGAEIDALVAAAPARFEQDAVLILHTSGSTGANKQVCCTQENLWYEAHNFVETLGLTAAGNILCTIPLFHSYGLGNCLLDAVYTGATLVLLEADGAPFAALCSRVLQLIREEEIRFYPGVPYQFDMLAALPESEGSELAGLDWCVSSGDTLAQHTFERFRRRFGISIRSLYGSTEAGSIAIDAGPDEVVDAASLGLPLRNVEIQIRDGGQIWVKSPGVAPGERGPDGFYNTGDIGRLDARYRLMLTGRKQTFVDVGGHKVDVSEVEGVLQSHPLVSEAAVLGVEAPGIGTLLKAVLVTRGACEQAAILEHCRARLAPYKLPRLIEFRDALPRSPIGKVLKKDLTDVSPWVDQLRPLAEFAQLRQAIRQQARPRQIELLSGYLRQQVAATLQRETAAVSPSDPFESMGFDSLRTAEMQQRLSDLTGLPLPLTLLWNYPSIDALSSALLDLMKSGRPA